MKENEESSNFQIVILDKTTKDFLGCAGLHHIDRKIPESLGGKIVREYDKINMSGRKLHLLEYRIYPLKK